MRIILLICTLFFCIGSSFAKETEKHVAILISSYGEEGRENLSYDLEELAQAYLVLHDNNIAIDILSPKGGAVLVKNNKDDLTYIKRFKHETNALKQLSSTISPQNADFSNYDAIMIIGGNGAMFDLPKDKNTQILLTKFANSEKPLAAVCHGPAALVNIKNTDGSYFVHGKKVNSFTNLEEHAFGGDVINSLPFLLEDKLKQNGATFVSNAPMLPFISVDNNLITAQNPGAVAKAAEALVIKLGLPLKPRILFKDEASLLLIAQARNSGSYLIDIELSANSEKYDLNYLALYGFYSYNLAQTKQDKRLELEIMQAIARHFSHPMYLSNLIKALWEQDLKQEALKTFSNLKTNYPDHEAINKLDLLLKTDS